MIKNIIFAYIFTNKKRQHIRKLLFNVSLIISLAFTLTPSALAQSNNKIIIKGTIIDDTGEPIPGVNVTPSDNPVKGTITNFEGKYLLETTAGSTLTFSFIGFETIKRTVTTSQDLDITLKLELISLDEVVTIGYGTAKKANLVGSVSTIQVDELEDFPVTSITSLFDGKIPGVSVNPSQPTGRPGADTRITIRGTNTFGTAGGGPKESNPLYVVDGFIVSQSEFDLLDPSEIESISVLKDASAAVYGARGANGVILITTKRGKEGKMRVNYSGSYGIGDATQQTPMLSAYDHARMFNDANPNKPEEHFTPEELELAKKLNYDWLDEAWQLSSTVKNSITLSGGSDKVKYFAGGNHVYESGNFKNLDVTKYSYRLGLDANLTKNLSASVTLSIDNKTVDIPYNQSVGTNTMENLFQPLLQSPRWIPHHIDGKPVYTESGNFQGGNPFAFFDTDSYRRSQYKGNTLNLMLKYDFEKVKGLEASVSYSRRENHSYSKEYSVPYTLYRFQAIDGGTHILSDEISEVKEIENRNAISEIYSFGQNYQLNAGLRYNKTFAELHRIEAFGTYEQTESSGHSFGATAKKQMLDGIQTQQGFNNEEAVSRGSRSEAGRLSGIGRLNYSYADKYIFEGTVRVETSTKFAPGQRTGVFPAFAAGWVISSEDFFYDNINFIDFLKLRASYGRTGTDYTGNYEYRLQYGLSGNYLFGNTALGGTSVQNDGVVATGATWEKSDKTNIGIDFRFLEQRISLSLDGFYNYNFDILDTRKVEFPTTAGIEKMVSENIGRMESWGYEMELGYTERFLDNKASFFIKGNFGYHTNRIIDRPTDLLPTDFRYPIGKSTTTIGADQGYVTHGIVRTQEEADAINQANMEKYGVPYTIFGKTIAPGMLYYQDIGRLGNVSDDEPQIVHEPDGKVDENDITYIQKVNDKLEWLNILPTSVSLGGTYYGFSLNMQFNLAYGLTSNSVDKLARTAPTKDYNSPEFWKDYYTEDNINAKYPSPLYASDNSQTSDFWMKNVYQLRLRTVNLSYRIPDRVIKDWGISTFRVFFAGTNVWTPISTFDYKDDAIARYNTYPLMKTFNFGVNITL